jgi:hypothetical protein
MPVRIGNSRVGAEQHIIPNLYPLRGADYCSTQAAAAADLYDRIFAQGTDHARPVDANLIGSEARPERAVVTYDDRAEFRPAEQQSAEKPAAFSELNPPDICRESVDKARSPSFKPVYPARDPSHPDSTQIVIHDDFPFALNTTEQYRYRLM